jgi:hypothetical protein
MVIMLLDCVIKCIFLVQVKWHRMVIMLLDVLRHWVLSKVLPKGLIERSNWCLQVATDRSKVYTVPKSFQCTFITQRKSLKVLFLNSPRFAVEELKQEHLYFFGLEHSPVSPPSHNYCCCLYNPKTFHYKVQSGSGGHPFKAYSVANMTS